MSPTLTVLAIIVGALWALAFLALIFLFARYNRHADGTRRAHVDRKGLAIQHELYGDRSGQVFAAPVDPPVDLVA